MAQGMATQTAGRTKRQNRLPCAWYALSTCDVSTRNYIKNTEKLKKACATLTPQKKQNTTTVALDCPVPLWKRDTARWPLKISASWCDIHTPPSPSPISRPPYWTESAIARKSANNTAVIDERREHQHNTSHGNTVACEFGPKRSATTNLWRRLKGTGYLIDQQTTA